LLSGKILCNRGKLAYKQEKIDLVALVVSDKPSKRHLEEAEAIV